MESTHENLYRFPFEADIGSLEKYLKNLNDRLQLFWDIQDGLTKAESSTLLNAILLRLEAEIIDNISSPGQKIDDTVKYLLDKWRCDIKTNIETYEESMRHVLMQFNTLVCEKIYPLFSLVEQTRQVLRYSRRIIKNKDYRHKFFERLPLIRQLIESIHLRSLSMYNVEFWREATEYNLGIPIPTFVLPDDIFHGVESLPQDIQKFELAIEMWNPSKPFIPRTTDWFSKKSLNFTKNTFWFRARLLNEPSEDGTFGVWLQEPNSSVPSISELLWFLSERLKFKIHGCHPSLTRLDQLVDYKLSQTMIVTYLKREAHRGIILENHMKEGYCLVLLVDIGVIESFRLNQIYIDENPESELHCIPPLSMECSFLPGGVNIQNHETWLFRSVLSSILRDKGKNEFWFRVLGSYCHPNGKLIRQIYISEDIQAICTNILSTRDQRILSDVKQITNAYQSQNLHAGEDELYVNNSSVLQTTPLTDGKFRCSLFTENPRKKLEEIVASEGMSCFVQSCYKLIEEIKADQSKSGITDSPALEDDTLTTTNSGFQECISGTYDSFVNDSDKAVLKKIENADVDGSTRVQRKRKAMSDHKPSKRLKENFDTIQD